jgi:hypothetical protein
MEDNFTKIRKMRRTKDMRKVSNSIEIEKSEIVS